MKTPGWEVRKAAHVSVPLLYGLYSELSSFDVGKVQFDTFAVLTNSTS